MNLWDGSSILFDEVRYSNEVVQKGWTENIRTLRSGLWEWLGLLRARREQCTNMNQWVVMDTTMKVVFTLLCVLSLWTLVFIYVRFQINYTVMQKIRVIPTVQQQQQQHQQHYLHYAQYHVMLGPHSDVSRSKYLDLLIVVPSSYNHDAAERRSVIRRTWANRSFYPQFNTRHVFVMGKWISRIYLLVNTLVCGLLPWVSKSEVLSGVPRISSTRKHQPHHTFEFFAVCTKLSEMAILYSKDLTTAKKSYLQWGSTWCYRLLLV